MNGGPLSASYFAAAERDLGPLMTRIAANTPEDALTLWHRALRWAAEQAWQRLLVMLGMSPRALQAEARFGPRLHGLLRQQLPSAFPSLSPPVTPQEA